MWSLTTHSPLWSTWGRAQSQEIVKTWYTITQRLLHRKTSLSQKSRILTNSQAFPYPGRPVNKTQCSQVPNICLQGLIPKLHPAAWQKSPVSEQETETIPDTPIPFAIDVSLQLGLNHKVIQSNSVQNPTEINLDASMMASPSVEEHNMPSQSSRLIP